MDISRASSSLKCARTYQSFKYRYITRRQCLLAIFFLLMIQLVIFNYSFYIYRFKWTKNNAIEIIVHDQVNREGSLSSNETENGDGSYKYPLIDSTEVIMNLSAKNGSSYKWFNSQKKHFLNIGREEVRTYSQDTAICLIDEHLLGPITVQKSVLPLDWVEKQHPDVKPGGYYAPANCRSQYNVAIFIPYRDRKQNLSILLYYLHSILKKQLLEYRIFVIEQFGTDKWNKGALYNVAYLESQRFGTWDCLIFHDVDTVPEHEGIIYGCSGSPVHLAAAVEKQNYTLPYPDIFGGVTALTPSQYESVNGYSNIYWNWGGEDDDMYLRLSYENYTVTRYNTSLARYSSLPHNHTEKGDTRFFIMYLCHRFKMYKLEGLRTTQYKLISVTKNKLYTHLLADINPNKININSKTLLQHLVHLYGKSMKFHTVMSRVIRYHRRH